MKIKHNAMFIPLTKIFLTHKKLNNKKKVNLIKINTDIGYA